MYSPSYHLSHPSAFVPGRQVSNNVLIAYELMHFLRERVGANRVICPSNWTWAKLIIRVEWDYLKISMETIGFNPSTIHLIMQYISTASFFVLINGMPHGHIVPSWELRQRDPLSSYLFLCILKAGLICDRTRKNTLGCKKSNYAIQPHW